MRTKGWKNVYAFTFFQTVKSKSFIVSTSILTAIMLLLIAGAAFLPGLISNGGEGTYQSPEETVNSIQKMYLYDETGLSSYWEIDDNKLEDLNLTVVPVDAASLEQVRTDVRNAGSSQVLVEITKSNKQIRILLSEPENKDIIRDGSSDVLINYLKAKTSDAHLLSLGVAQENLENADISIRSQITVAGEKPENEYKFIVNTFVPMLSSIILFIFIIMYSQLVGQAIAVEKTSRVMELLLTSIKPLAIIIGKVLAMCTIALSQIIWFAAVCGIGGFAMFSLAGSPIQQVPTAMDPGDFDMNAMMEAISESFSSFNALSIVLLIVIFLMGFLFYSLIAGLFGASISRAEDLQSSMQPMALISVLGFYLSYFPSITGNISQENVLIAISRYLPISSPFALPSAILLGEMTPLEIGISLVLLGVSLVLMALLVSKVYEAIVLHNGNRLKFSEIIKLAKNK